MIPDPVEKDYESTVPKTSQIAFDSTDITISPPASSSVLIASEIELSEEELTPVFADHNYFKGFCRRTINSDKFSGRALNIS